MKHDVIININNTKRYPEEMKSITMSLQNNDSTIYIHYVCMYVCIYVRTYVCMYIRTYVRMYVYICMYVCMYVHMGI